MRKLLVAHILILLIAAFVCAQDAGRPPTEEEKKAFLEQFARLGSDLYGERKAAAEAIIALGPSVIPLLEERKEQTDPEVREAVKRLIKELKFQIEKARIAGLIKQTGVEEEPEELLKLYTSPKDIDRKNFLLRVTVRRTPACIPIAREFLSDASDEVVNTAMKLLGELVKGKDAGIATRILEIVARTPADVEIIFDRINYFLKFADFRQDSILGALTGLADGKAKELILTSMILAPQEHFVFAFASMLGAQDRFMRRYCAGGIEVTVRELLQGKGRQMFSFEKSEMQKLSNLLAPALSSDDPVVVNVVAGAIGRTGASGPAPRLIELLGDKDISTVRRAAVSLGLMKAKKAAPALLGLLQGKSYEALPEAADALGRIADPQSFQPLLALLKKKEIPFRELILHAMAQADLKRTAEVLPAFLADRNIAVRALAVDKLAGALGLYPSLRSSKIPVLLDIVRKGPGRAKFSAARVIGEVGDALLLPGLKKLTAESDPEVRASVMLPLAMIAGASVKEVFLCGLKDADYQVRFRAAEALGYLGDWTEFLKVAKIPIEVEESPVVEALQSIAFSTGIHLVIDPSAIRMNSLDEQMVSLSLKGKTLLEALVALKQEFDIAWDGTHYVLFVTVSPRKDVLKGFSLPRAPIGCSATEIEIEKKLATRLTLDSVSEPIESFFERVGKKTGVSFELDKSVRMRLDETLRKVDFTADKVPLSAVLHLVLAPRGLAARIRGGAVAITAGK